MVEPPDLGCQAELESDSGVALRAPLSWPVDDTTNLRLEMGQDGADQYATAMVSARGPWMTPTVLGHDWPGDGPKGSRRPHP